MNSYVNTYRKSSTFQRHPGANSMSLVTGLLPFTSEMALFEFPFNELLIWAVLTKRQEMSILMWAHGEESLAKSLVACKLYKAMAHEAAEDDLDTEIYDELKSYAKDFEAKGLKLLDFCYRIDAERAQRLLTCELHSWSNQSCLSLAVAANHRALLAHPCSQVILADLWMGGLRTRKNTNLKVWSMTFCRRQAMNVLNIIYIQQVILGLVIPPFITRLDFKSKEELQSMPQTEEEHLENQNLDYEDQEKSHPDAEVTYDKPSKSIWIFISFNTISQSNFRCIFNSKFFFRFFSLFQTKQFFSFLIWTNERINQLQIQIHSSLGAFAFHKTNAKNQSHKPKKNHKNQTPVLRRKSLIINRKSSAAAQVEPLYVKVNCRQENHKKHNFLLIFLYFFTNSIFFVHFFFWFLMENN